MSTGADDAPDTTNPFAIGWNAGNRFKAARVLRGYTMVELAARTAQEEKRWYSDGSGVSSSQISRIERQSDPTLREFHLLCLALNLNPLEIIAATGQGPWEVYEAAGYDEILKEMKTRKLSFHRQDNAHRLMYAAGKYRYVPLEQPDDERHEDDLVQLLKKLEANSRSRSGLRPVMRPLIFESDWVDEDLMLEGIAEHHGEEVLIVLQGQAELWLLKQPDEMTPPQRSEWVSRRPRADHFHQLTLGPGDCAHYLSTIPHGYRAREKGQTMRAAFIYSAPTQHPVTETIFTGS